MNKNDIAETIHKLEGVRWFKNAEEMMKAEYATLKSANDDMVINNKGPAVCLFHVRGLCEGNQINFTRGFSGILKGDECVIETEMIGKIKGNNNHIICEFQGINEGQNNTFHGGISKQTTLSLKPILPESKDRKCVIMSCSNIPSCIMVCSQMNIESLDEEDEIELQGLMHEGYCRSCSIMLISTPCLHCKTTMYIESYEIDI